MSKGYSCQPICSLPLHRRRGFKHFAAECVNRSSAGSASGSQQKQNAAGAATAFGRDFVQTHYFAHSCGAHTSAQARVFEAQAFSHKRTASRRVAWNVLGERLAQARHTPFPARIPSSRRLHNRQRAANPEGPLPTSPRDPIACSHAQAPTSSTLLLAQHDHLTRHNSQQPCAICRWRPVHRAVPKHKGCCLL